MKNPSMSILIVNCGKELSRLYLSFMKMEIVKKYDEALEYIYEMNLIVKKLRLVLWILIRLLFRMLRVEMKSYLTFVSIDGFLFVGFCWLVFGLCFLFLCFSIFLMFFFFSVCLCDDSFKTYSKRIKYIIAMNLSVSI